jgi:broad specificity phosphatase PhoE
MSKIETPKIDIELDERNGHEEAAALDPVQLAAEAARRSMGEERSNLDQVLLTESDARLAVDSAFGEVEESAEVVKPGQKISIILMRHGEPYRPGVVPDNAEDAARLGKLTEKGVEQAWASAKHEAEQALADGEPTTFFFLGSPTPYYIDGEAFAQRSMETAQVARRAVEDVISSMGLTEEQADIHDLWNDIDGARPAKNLGEPDFYHVYGSEKPDDYANAVRQLAKEEGSIDKYGGPGHLEPWLRSDETLEDLRKEVGAQSAPEVAERVMKFMRVLERYATAYAKEHPGRKLVFFSASHGEILRTVIQHGFKAEDGADGKVYDMAEVMPITVENYKASTSFRGKTYEVDVSRSSTKE